MTTVCLSSGIRKQLSRGLPERDFTLLKKQKNNSKYNFSKKLFIYGSFSHLFLVDTYDFTRFSFLGAKENSWPAACKTRFDLHFSNDWLICNKLFGSHSKNTVDYTMNVAHFAIHDELVGIT